MLGNLFKKKTDEQISKEMQKKRDLIIARSAALRKLVNAENTGWREYVALLEEYIAACKRRKAVTPLDTADEKTLEQLKRLDHEIWLISSFILKIPEQMFEREKQIDKENEDGRND